MKSTAKYTEELISIILGADRARQATAILAKNQIIRATRRTFKGKFLRGNIEILVTIGKPNYRERKLIKKGFVEGNVELKRLKKRGA